MYIYALLVMIKSVIFIKRYKIKIDKHSNFKVKIYQIYRKITAVF